MPTVKKGMPKLSPFAQMLRDKREKLAPLATLREFCAARGFEVLVIDDMERDRRTAPGTFTALYKLASGYGHGPTDRWTMQLLDAALGKAPPKPVPAKATRRSIAPRSAGSAGAARKTAGRSRPPATDRVKSVRNDTRKGVSPGR